MFEDWSQPVVSKPWGMIAAVTDWICRKTNWRLFPHFSHRAWEKAVGLK